MQLLQTPEEFQKQYPMVATGVAAAKKYNEDLPAEDRKQAVDRDNVPLWNVMCAMTDNGRSTPIMVRMASVSEPNVAPGVIMFGGLTISTYSDGSRVIARFEADTFTQEPPPSSKRAKAVEPPVPAS